MSAIMIAVFLFVPTCLVVATLRRMPEPRMVPVPVKASRRLRP